jgi:hypothetical protein
MMMHPDVLSVLANARHRELIAESDQRRLLNLARKARAARQAGKAPPARERLPGTLASCEPAGVVPAR